MSSRDGETLVVEPAWVRALVWTAFPALGAGGGWLLKLAAGWVASLSWAPFQGLFRVVAELTDPEATIGALAIGGLAGLAVAQVAARERLAVAVAVDGVTLTRDGSSRVVSRGRVSHVFLDGRQLVLLGPDGGELAREPSDLDGAGLRAAFLGHGYPWRADGDPYAAEFRRWVPDTPELPPGADALLHARQRALQTGNHRDIVEFRAELAKLGIVVRDEKKRQYWRPAARRRPEPPPDHTATEGESAR